MGTPLGWTVTSTLRNSTGSKTAWTGTGKRIKGNEFGERSWSVSGSLSARPSPSVQFSFAPEYLNEKGTNGSFNGRSAGST